MELNRSCGYCKYFEQGKTCSFCCNPNQTDENLKKYAYYSFGTQCQLFEKGVHPNREEATKHIHFKED